MKLNKFIKIIILLIVCVALQIILFGNISNAVLEGNKSWQTTQRKLGNAFDLCRELQSPTSSLGTNTLDPHLSNARDLGASIFLGLSQYGTVNDNSNENRVYISMTNPPRKYNNSGSYDTNTSTTGNMSGVIGIGINSWEWMAMVRSNNENVSGFTDQLFDSTNAKYVDNVASDSVQDSKGMPLGEIKNNGRYWYNDGGESWSNDAGRYMAVTDIYGTCSSAEMSDYFGQRVFRACIWN